MNLPFETMKSFDSDVTYKKRIVAFVDVMGMRNRIAQSSKPQDFKMYATILSMFENQPFAEGKIHISAFSDGAVCHCMSSILSDRLLVKKYGMIRSMPK